MEKKNNNNNKNKKNTRLLAGDFGADIFRFWEASCDRVTSGRFRLAKLWGKKKFVVWQVVLRRINSQTYEAINKKTSRPVCLCMQMQNLDFLSFTGGCEIVLVFSETGIQTTPTQLNVLFFDFLGKDSVDRILSEMSLRGQNDVNISHPMKIKSPVESRENPRPSPIFGPHGWSGAFFPSHAILCGHRCPCGGVPPPA